MKSIVFMVTALLSLVLCACGFHLRRAVELPPEMKLLYISASGQTAGLVRELGRTLASEDTHIVVNPDTATATLAILQARQTSRVLSVNSLGQPLEYEVAYEVRFSLNTAKGISIPSQDMTLTRNYAYSVSNAVANQEQANVLYGVLDRDMAQLIVFRIQAAARKAAPPHPAPGPATVRMPAAVTPPGT